ncbi:MAG: glycosyltransferase family 1 protein [Pontiellaceae bacterium]|nr:glycosyltransferase family 1 protein [Pontiellaceae bacterium]MBN2784547.1 glycosyltransferase family 1 protein [Pontiellaceae bacterium]
MNRGLPRDAAKPRNDVSTDTFSSLRIVHACNFHYNKSGDKFDTMDARIHHGLIENGHYVYPFPVHDIGRQMHWSSSKRLGAKKANQSLIDTCRKVRPDILMLGHSQSITRETLKTIRANQPEIKIAQWFCDWFYSVRAFKFQFIYDRLDLLDAFFATTAGDKLESFHQKGCRTAFIPNPVHPALERYRAFDSEKHDYDLVFFGTDRKDPERRATLQEIDDKLGKDFKVGIFGSLDRPGIYGYEKDMVLTHSKAALNLTRLPEPMKWYSSDRIASLMGNGLLACTRAEADLHELYGSDTMLYYNSTDHLIEQLSDVLNSGKWKTIAQNGWELSHSVFTTRRVAAFMTGFVLGSVGFDFADFSI